MLATSDLPGGVVNLLTGFRKEMVPTFATHTHLRAIAGEYDFQSRHISLSNLPVLLENAEAGNYTIHLDPAQHGADGAFMFNQSYQADEEIGKWLRRNRRCTNSFPS